MSWVVRIERADPETIEVAATLADASGWAQDGNLALVGFEDRSAADDFASAYGGAVEVATTWTDEDLAQVHLRTGVITLDAGTAFGHGAHPTTALALDALGSLGPGDRRTLLDVGTGTGVLSIAAARQGFVATGCDIDPDAVRIAVSNAQRNCVEAHTSFVVASPSQLAAPQWLATSAGFDVVVINALIGVHEAEGAAIVRLAAPTATIIATGVQQGDQVDRAVAAYQGYAVAERSEDGPWSVVVLRQ